MAADPARAERVRTEFAEALHQAAAEGRPSAVEILLELGCRSTGGTSGAAPHCITRRGGATETSSSSCSRAARSRRRAPTTAPRRSASTAHGSFHSPGPVAGGGTDHLRIAQRLVAGAVIEPEMVHEAAPDLAKWLVVQAGEPEKTN